MAPGKGHQCTRICAGTSDADLADDRCRGRGVGRGGQTCPAAGSGPNNRKATSGGIKSDALQDLQAEGAAAAGVPLNKVAVDTWLECDGNRQPDFDGVCTDSEQVGRYVSVAITSGYKPMFSVFAWAVGSDGKIPLTGKSSVRVQ